MFCTFADGVRRDLHRPADRGDRRPGQPAAERAEHEVLRGDVADRAHCTPRRLRPAFHQPQGLERDGPGEAEFLPGGGRQGERLERRRAPEARSRAGRRVQEAGPRGLCPGCRRFPRPRAEGVPRFRRSEGMAEGDARKNQRVEVMRSIGAWLRRRAENFAAGLLAVMFVAFMVQIVFRYFFNFPIGWTSELSVIAWLWLVLWGAAFVVKESEEIRFDLVYGAAGRRTRRVMGKISGISIVVLYAASLPASVKYITFMKVESASYLKIRFDLDRKSTRLNSSH